jgi:hypothetical protein
MEFVLILRELAGRWRIVAIGAAVALVVAVFSVYRVDGFSLKPRALVHSSASTQVLVDSASSVLGNVSQSFEPLASRAGIYANFMTSPTVLSVIGRHVGLSGEQLYASGPVNLDEPRVEQEPTALKRNIEITGESKPYRLGFESQANLPTITINAQAPTTAKAVALANAAAVGMEEYVAASETANGVASTDRVIIRQLGPARGGVDDAAIRKSLALLAFIAILLLWCVGMLVVPRARKAWRESAALPALGGDAAANGHRPPVLDRVPGGEGPLVVDGGAGDDPRAGGSGGGHAVVIDGGADHDPRAEGNGIPDGDRADAATATMLNLEADSPEGHAFDVPPYRADDDRPAVPARGNR